MLPTGTIWTTLVGDHPGIIPVKFGKSGFRGEDVQVKKFTHDGQRPITIGHPEHFVLRWAKKKNMPLVLGTCSCTSSRANVLWKGATCIRFYYFNDMTVAVLKI